MIYPSVDNLPRHPSQLYEAFFEGILLFLILFFLFQQSIKKHSKGIVSGFFLLFYGIFRFLIEFIREPDSHIGFIYNFLTMGQILCIPIILFGLIILLNKKRYV